MKKEKTSYALSSHARRLLALIAAKLGVSRSDVLEMLIREDAEKRHLVLLQGGES